jgi:hypothetical protein
MERFYKGRWVPVNPPVHVGEVIYSRTAPWGAYNDPPDPLEELVMEALSFEDRVPSRAQWWYFGRNYDSFGRLSGVRRDGMTYREPNGIPDDVSDQVQVLWGPDELGRSDWHTPTHWTLEDLDECHREGIAKDPCGYGIQRISEMLQEMWRVAREYNLEPDQVRVVLWYDN